MSDFYEKLVEIAGSSKVKVDEEMKNHTTFRVGGPAAFYVSPANAGELARVVGLCRSQGMPWYVLGKGSNLLVGDKGYEGVVVSLAEGFGHCQAEGCQVRAGAGASLARVARTALDASLAGFEFAAGIPGTLGGAVVMNAGAYGTEMKDVLRQVQVLDGQGLVRTLTAEELDLGYRTSCVPDRGYILLEGLLELKTGSQQQVRALMEDLAARRKSKQPLEYPSAGSTFKRPPGHFAGKLIQDAGLRGFRHGGAAVSEKHCGFVVNLGQATSRDILELCQMVKERVLEHSGVALELEVKQLGKF